MREKFYQLCIDFKISFTSLMLALRYKNVILTFLSRDLHTMCKEFDVLLSFGLIIFDTSIIQVKTLQFENFNIMHLFLKKFLAKLNDLFLSKVL